MILLFCFAVFAVAGVLVYFYWGSSEENMDKSDVDEPISMKRVMLYP